MAQKLSHKGGYLLLTDKEKSNLAKLLETTEMEINNMSKQEYRRLCIKFHPDKNPGSKEAESSFNIVNSLYNK